MRHVAGRRAERQTKWPSRCELERLDDRDRPDDLAGVLTTCSMRFAYVIDSVADLLPVLDDIGSPACGEQP